jgi:hypothetical protein
LLLLIWSTASAQQRHTSGVFLQAGAIAVAEQRSSGESTSAPLTTSFSTRAERDGVAFGGGVGAGVCVRPWLSFRGEALGVDAEYCVTSRLMLVPQLRAIGAGGGLRLRPGMSARFSF